VQVSSTSILKLHPHNIWSMIFCSHLLQLIRDQLHFIRQAVIQEMFAFQLLLRARVCAATGCRCPEQKERSKTGIIWHYLKKKRDSISAKLRDQKTSAWWMVSHSSLIKNLNGARHSLVISSILCLQIWYPFRGNIQQLGFLQVAANNILAAFW